MNFHFRMEFEARLFAALLALAGVAVVLLYNGGAADQVKEGIGAALLAVGLFFGRGRGLNGPDLRV